MKTFTQCSGSIQTEMALQVVAAVIPHCDNNLYTTAVARCQPLYSDYNIDRDNCIAHSGSNKKNTTTIAAI